MSNVFFSFSLPKRYDIQKDEFTFLEAENMIIKRLEIKKFL